MSNPPSSGTGIATVDRNSSLAQDESLEFEVMGPSDAKEEIYDVDDDLATPLEPLSKE